MNIDNVIIIDCWCACVWLHARNCIGQNKRNAGRQYVCSVLGKEKCLNDYEQSKMAWWHVVHMMMRREKRGEEEKAPVSQEVSIICERIVD